MHMYMYDNKYSNIFRNYRLVTAAHVLALLLLPTLSPEQKPPHFNLGLDYVDTQTKHFQKHHHLRTKMPPPHQLYMCIVYSDWAISALDLIIRTYNYNQVQVQRVVI